MHFIHRDGILNWSLGRISTENRDDGTCSDGNRQINFPNGRRIIFSRLFSKRCRHLEVESHSNAPESKGFYPRGSCEGFNSCVDCKSTCLKIPQTLWRRYGIIYIRAIFLSRTCVNTQNTSESFSSFVQS